MVAQRSACSPSPVDAVTASRVRRPPIAIVLRVGMQGFEQRLERSVEGAFGKIFRSGVKPVEFGRKIQREMDGNRTLGVSGATIVPNQFTIGVSEVDHEQLADYLGALRRDLTDAVREHAREEGYVFMGPIDIAIDPMANLRKGQMSVKGRIVEGEGGAPPGTLVLPTGERVPLGEYTVSVGRWHECTIVLGDPNVSRNHAEIRPAVDGYVVADLGSTNGTKVNGVRVAEHQLRDGDEVRFGNTVMHFEAS